MASSFGITDIADFLKRMGIKIAHLDYEQHTIELSFHGDHGQWRMVIGIHQRGNASKLMLIVPHVGTATSRKRLECLEALMAVNYRIAIGKFGLDLEDGEVRLEETIPLANNAISFEQFRLAFSAIMQTASIYHSLLPRIVYGNCSVEEALQACEQEFFQEPTPNEVADEASDASQTDHTRYTAESHANTNTVDELPEFDVEEVLEEVVRLLKEARE
jgi:hypothetical protein